MMMFSHPKRVSKPTVLGVAMSFEGCSPTMPQLGDAAQLVKNEQRVLQNLPTAPNGSLVIIIQPFVFFTSLGSTKSIKHLYNETNTWPLPTFFFGELIITVWDRWLMVKLTNAMPAYACWQPLMNQLPTDYWITYAQRFSKYIYIYIMILIYIYIYK